MVAARPKHPRPDRNQAEIVEDCRNLGMVVWIVQQIGGTVLDLVVSWKGEMRPVEVKMPGHERDLTAGEHEAILQLRRVGVEPIIATCVEDILEAWGDEAEID